jgi:hypothetical protein
MRASQAAWRAWLVLSAAAGLFALIVAGLIFLGLFVHEHASTPRTATATVISGTGALWRTGPEAEWLLFDGTVRLREGNEVSTELGTVVWVTFFDGSTLEISERSLVGFSRMRVTRFQDSAKQIVLRVAQGSVYGAMAPHGDYRYAETEIVTDAAAAVMVDEDGRPQAGSYLVEVAPVSTQAPARFRAAVFRGVLRVTARGEESVLNGPEQLSIAEDGAMERSNQILGQLIVNGTFESGLNRWETIYTAAGREPARQVGRTELIARDDASDGSQAVRLYRDTANIWALTGIRQTIDRTLRLPSALTLSFDIRIDQQGGPVNGSGTVPLGVELAYVDILGQERVWRTAYVVRRDDAVIDANLVTPVVRSQWTHVIFDLHNLEPIPKFLRTVVVYANGTSYQSQVANISLTTSDGSSSGP